MGRLSCCSSTLDRRLHECLPEYSISAIKQACGCPSVEVLSLPQQDVNLVPKNNRKHVCNVCQKRCRVIFRLKAHERIHNGERPFPCPLCSKAFIQKSTLTRHMALVHGVGGRLYQCCQCDYSTKQKGHLLRHQRIHSGLKPFKCALCDSAYNLSSGL